MVMSEKTVKRSGVKPVLLISVSAYIAAFFVPLLIRSPYQLNVLISAMVSAALGMAFLLTLKAGMINMTLPTFWGIGAYFSAILVRDTGLNTWLAMPIAVLGTTLIAFLLGYLLLHSSSSGFSFVMLSQVVTMLFVQVLNNIDYLGGKLGFAVSAPDPIKLPFLEIRFTGDKIAYFYFGLLMLGLVILIVKAFYASWVGRAWTSIGMSSQLASSIGVNLFRYKLLAFVVSSSIAGIAGVFFAHFSQYLLPSQFSMWKNMYIQIYAIMGGSDFGVLGPILGGTVMNILPEAVRFAETAGTIVTGVLLMLLVLFLPKGLMSIPTLVAEKVREKKRERTLEQEASQK